MTNSKSPILKDEILASKIYFISGTKVMLDRDLAELYGVETNYLKRQVKRNIDRFPRDFMFQISKIEHENLRRQFGTLKQGEHSKYLPFAFTEQGVAMLSSVLKSSQAIAVNIQIIRIFTKMRELLLANKDILLKLEQLETKVGSNCVDIENIFKVLRQLINPETEPRKKIGYKSENEEE